MVFFAFRRIAVCGSSVHLGTEAAGFCETIGEQLGSHPNIIILSRGIKIHRASSSPSEFAADFHFISGALRRIPESDLMNRIETYVNKAARSSLFMEGKVLRAEGRSGEARRFYMISKADALISIRGGPGTLQQLALANALDLPVLPIPTFDGTSREFWGSHKDEICRRLRFSASEAEWVESSSPSEALAKALTSALIGALERRCFVIMPFAQDEEMIALYDQVIAPAVLGLGDRPIRLDRAGLPGNVGQQIEQGITTCDYAIAVLDREKPNVFYELGLAHAQKKPVIILRGRTNSTAVPFDISMHQRIEYDVGDEQTSRRVQAAIASVFGKNVMELNT